MTSVRKPSKRWTLALALAGCLTAPVVGCETPTRPGPADLAFVAQMLPHHHLGVLLVNEAIARSQDVRLRRMVFEMGSYHQREVDQLAAWAETWDVTPADDFPGDLPGAEVARLAAIEGLGHDTWWLHLMIAHHEGAVRIANDATGSATIGEVRELASAVRSVQSQELAAMRELLTELCTDEALPGCAAG